MSNIATVITIVIVVAILRYVFIPGALVVLGPGSDLNLEDCTELLRLVETGDAKFVAVRTPREFAGNALSEAINVSLQQMAARYEKDHSPKEPVILYRRSGNRSSQARAYPEEQVGYEEVYELGSHRSAKRVMTPSE